MASFLPRTLLPPPTPRMRLGEGRLKLGKRGGGGDVTPKVDPVKGTLPHPWKQGLEQRNRELGCRSQFRLGSELAVCPGVRCCSSLVWCWVRDGCVFGKGVD